MEALNGKTNAEAESGSRARQANGRLGAYGCWWDLTLYIGERGFGHSKLSVGKVKGLN